jgi:transcriptional regulator with XRE-family HTH domain
VPKKRKQTQNIVGPQVAKLRYQAKLSQSGFAATCQRMDWDISRGIVAAIEGGVRCVTDAELVNLARALRVPLETLLPEKIRKQLRITRTR